VPVSNHEDVREANVRAALGSCWGGIVVRAVVVYESMYGNTHVVADAIGEGLREAGDVLVTPVDDVGTELLEGADLVIVGGPTHAHGTSRGRTREAAAEAARKPDRSP
jgi:Flavodoxin